MEVTFPANTTVTKESSAIQTASLPSRPTVSENTASHSAAAAYFNPKLTVDAKSGMVLVQYRSQDGETRLQIPAQSVVNHYTAHGYRQVDPPGTMPEASDQGAAAPSADSVQTPAPAASSSTGSGETAALA